MNVDLTENEIGALLAAKDHCIANYKDEQGYLRMPPYYIEDGSLDSAVDKLENGLAS